MSIRKRNRKTSNRRDSSTPQIPSPTPVTITPIAGGVNVQADQGIVNQGDDPSTKTTGWTLKNTAGTFTGPQIIADQVNQFNVSLTAEALLPGTFSGTLELSPGNTGLRGVRGGVPMIPTLVFP